MSIEFTHSRALDPGWNTNFKKCHLDSVEGASVLSAHGWSIAGTPLRGLVRATILSFRDFSLSRMTAEPTIFQVQTTVQRQKQILLFVVESGCGTVSVDGAQTAFIAGDIIVMRRGAIVKFIFETPTALTHVRTSWSRFSRTTSPVPSMSRPFRGNDAFRSSLVANIGFIIDSGHTHGDSALLHARRSVEASIDALFAAHAESKVVDVSVRAQGQFLEAIAVIEELCDQVSTSPDTVARELGLSRKHLEVVFRKSGKTVAGYIRMSRAVRARRLILDRNDGVPLKLKDIASHTGFPSVRSMNLAVNQLELEEGRH